MKRKIKKYHPPGTSPGTLSPADERAAGPVRVTLVEYDAETVRERPVRSIGDAVQALPSLPPTSLAWLQVVGHDPVQLAQLGALGVHQLVLEDMLNIGQRPKVEDYASYLFIVVDVLRHNGEGRLEEEQVSVLLTDRLVVTVQERETPLLKPIVERLGSGRGRIRSGGSDYLAYAIVDVLVDHYFPVLDGISERLEVLEDALLDRPSVDTLHGVHEVKQDLLRLRKATWPLREMVGALSRSDSHLVQEGNRLWFRDVYDHTVQIMDIVETFRDMTGGLLDLYLSSVSNRMNEIMKVLTIMSTIFIPLTFIAGIYGMNFDTDASPLNMPELHWYLGYPFALALMVGVGLALVWMFRRRGWL